MLLAILTCGHWLLADEENGAQTSERCPECDLWCGVESYEERA